MKGYWSWFLTGRRPGLYKFLDRWIFFHLAVAGVLGLLLPITLQSTASTLLFPLAGVLVGLSFSWGGNAIALLQTTEIEDFAKQNIGGLEEYIYTFQSAVLCLLVTIVSWGIAGLGVFDLVWPKNMNSCTYKSIAILLFFISSIAVREGWHVVLGSQTLLLVRYRIRTEALNKKSLNQASTH